MYNTFTPTFINLAISTIIIVMIMQRLFSSLHQVDYHKFIRWSTIFSDKIFDAAS